MNKIFINVICLFDKFFTNHKDKLWNIICKYTFLSRHIDNLLIAKKPFIIDYKVL